MTRMAERLGGRFLARTSKIEKIEGERKAPQILTVIEWPSKETAEAFYESDDYRRHRQGRIKGQEMSFCSWQEKT